MGKFKKLFKTKRRGKASKSEQSSPLAADRKGSNVGNISARAVGREYTGSDSISNEASVVKSYDSIPLIEMINLPRGGISFETQAVGRVQVSVWWMDTSFRGCVFGAIALLFVSFSAYLSHTSDFSPFPSAPYCLTPQFGIPPETIKDSMVMGLGVPSVYIVPIERFCREMGPALGVNLAEFEFPAYFNYFVQQKRCTLIVDSKDAEKNIRRVFSETLLGPAQFRRKDNPITFEEEDFAPTFPRDAIPNFQKETKHFRIMPDGKELVLETLLKFSHFKVAENGAHNGLGVPSAVDSAISLSGSSGASIPTLPAKDDLADGAKGKDKQVTISRRKPWSYSQAKCIGDVATVYPEDATPEQKATGTTKRIEIFRMPGGTEYIMHDVDEKNIIVGKARFYGNVVVPESMKVDGFSEKEDGSGALSDNDEDNASDAAANMFAIQGQHSGEVPRPILPPSFYPPSFGVTVLGNSHGFDKNGSVSGYVLWINGRGVMIDPPPYASATLEREGIRPRMIVGIIITHCHADHDAGTFQKILTGSPVVLITTPTIYKSFIRKYSALSALSPALLRHCHRYKPAIIGEPLRFQGATLNFTYSLHTIPCVGFRVEWRGRSMVFTADHFNSPEGIQKMQDAVSLGRFSFSIICCMRCLIIKANGRFCFLFLQGTLTKGRADDLRNLAMQETDCLLHEAGAPPIHTPLEVLMKFPQHVKDRMYIVHTSNLPADCDLRVAPTGTDGTIRLDELNQNSVAAKMRKMSRDDNFQQSDLMLEVNKWDRSEYSSSFSGSLNLDAELSLDNIGEDEETGPEAVGKRATAFEKKKRNNSFEKKSRAGSLLPLSSSGSHEIPLVSLRPASSTDAWFILNLLSSVPFLADLNYSSTMEVLEKAKVDTFAEDDIVVPANLRQDVLCVVWEGTCMEREQSSQTTLTRAGSMKSRPERQRRVSSYQLNQGKHTPLTAREASANNPGAVWFAGDWTGPRALQPEERLSGESMLSSTHDIVAMSAEGVKVITIEFPCLHSILQRGSDSYGQYLARIERCAHSAGPNDGLNINEIININSGLRKLTAVQKRHLESIAKGPLVFKPGERLWREGENVDKAFIVVSGTCLFVPGRRKGGAISVVPSNVRDSLESFSDELHDDFDTVEGSVSLSDRMYGDAQKAVQQLVSIPLVFSGKKHVLQLMMFRDLSTHLFNLFFSLSIVFNLCASRTRMFVEKKGTLRLQKMRTV